LVGVQKLASLNSNIATRHILDGACDVTKRLAEAITYRIHDLLKFTDLKDDFARKIGVTAVKTLDSVKELHLHDFAIFLDLHLDAEERAKLENDMSDAIAKNQMQVQDKYKVLNVKNFKLALAYMTILVEKHQKKAQEQKAQEFKLQSDENIRAAQGAEQARQQTAQMINQFEMQLQQMTTQGELQKEEVRGNQDRLTLEMKINGDLQVAQVNGGVQMQKMNMVEENKDKRIVKQATQNSEMINQRKQEGAQPIDFEAKEIDMSEFEM